jgi:hypothetical protein
MEDKRKLSIRTKDGGRIYFVINEFGEEVEVEDLLKIDYSVLLAEIMTFPVLLNRMGILLADCEHSLKVEEINIDIYVRKLKEKIRIKFEESNKKWVKDMIDDEAKIDPILIAKKQKLADKQKERDYVNSVYWSMKNKSELLVKLSLTIKQGDTEEFLLQEGLDNFNGIQIKYRKPLI